MVFPTIILDESPTSTPFGSIRDVSGVDIGHYQRIGHGWQTGTSVVSCRAGATPAVDVRGGGPGTRETDALQAGNLVEKIQAICLTGGSAYGLAAADGVMEELEGRGLGIQIADELVVPVVPTAVIFDLGRGGEVRGRPDSSFGRRAAAASLSARKPTAWGSVGAGTGANSGGLQGGVGTASTEVTVKGPATPDVPSAEKIFKVGALAVVNSHGTVIDPTSGLPWERVGRGWPRPDAAARRRLEKARTAALTSTFNTTIGVVTTDAKLDKSLTAKLATVAHDGLARAVRPAHSLVDGDTVFALATGVVEWPSELRTVVMNSLAAAAADVFALACTHAIVAARAVGDRPAWRDLID